MPPTPATPEMLAEMSACAYRLGLAFGEEAERTEDRGRRLELFQLFDRCFFAVRVATALQLRLRREATAAREPGGEVLSERDGAEGERPDSADDHDDPGRDPGRERFEADRDRDREPASLPIFLKTLRGVAADAAALPGPTPTELQTLRDLIVRATAEPSGPTRPPQGPPPRSPLRDRLAGSAALAILSPAPRPSPGPAARRATGPPRR